MLRTRLQMLPLLFLLLCMSKLGLSSPLSPGDMLSDSVDEDMPTQCNRSHEEVPAEFTEDDPQKDDDYYSHRITRVPMVESNNAIYEQFSNTPHSMYMVFNKTQLRDAVPKHMELFWAELLLFRRKQFKKQLVTMSEKYTNNTWGYVARRLMTPSQTFDRLWFDVTEVVQRWLNEEDDIEVFRIQSQSFDKNKNNALQMEISGITPNSDGDIPEIDNRNRPVLILLNIPQRQPKDVHSSQNP